MWLNVSVFETAHGGSVGTTVSSEEEKLQSSSAVLSQTGPCRLLVVPAVHAGTGFTASTIRELQGEAILLTCYL